MADDTVALQTKTPLVDGAQIIQQAQQSALTNQKIGEGNYSLEQAGRTNTEAQQKFQAVQDYQTAVKNNDPAAAQKAIQAFPDLHKTVSDAYNGQTPQQQDQEMQAAAAIAQSAQKIMSLDGSPQQTIVFQSEIGNLVKAGAIDQKTGDALLAKGPDRQILQLAMTAPDYVKAYGGGGYAKMMADIAHLQSETGKNNAEADKFKSQTGYFAQKGPTVAAKDKAATDRLNTQTNILKNGGVYVAPPPEPATTPPATTPPATAAPQDNTAKPQTQADFDAMPSGTLYVNPADDQTYKKK